MNDKIRNKAVNFGYKLFYELAFHTKEIQRNWCVNWFIKFAKEIEKELNKEKND